MPDLPVEPTGHGRYPGDMESRVAVLEQIARTTTEGLAQIMRAMEAHQDRLERRMDRLEHRIDLLAADKRSDFRWLLGAVLAGFTTLLGAFGAMLGVMAHGFHWL